MTTLHNPVVGLGNDLAVHCTFHVDKSLKVNLTLSGSTIAELVLKPSAPEQTVSSNGSEARVSCAAAMDFFAGALTLTATGRASSLSQVHVTSTEGRSDAVQQLRDFLVEAVAHRNHFLVGNLLGDDVAATLWAIGDTNTAILIRDVAARHYPIQRDPLPSNAGELVGSQAIAEITRQATTLSLITAAEIAAAALEKAVRDVD